MERDALKGGESRKARDIWRYQASTGAKLQGWRFEAQEEDFWWLIFFASNLKRKSAQQN
jgi:hypothetical protein